MTEWATSPLLDDPEYAPVTEPAVTHELSAAPARARVVIEGTVRAAGIVSWAGGPVLEVAVVDGTGIITLVFFGRERRTGIEPGRRLVARGTVGRHRGRRVILNPAIWLHADEPTSLGSRLVPSSTGRVAGGAPSSGAQGTPWPVP